MSSEDGDVFVVKAGPTYELLATNPVGEVVMATPAISGGMVIIRGVNHLLVPAITGDVTEYASLPDRNVSKDVSGAVSSWLTKTFAAVK